MKKVVFVLPHFLCGGVEKALLALVNEMSKLDYEITILMVKAEGELIDLIPVDVKYGILPLETSIREDLMLGGIRKSLNNHLKTRKLVKFVRVGFNVMKKKPLATLTVNLNKIKPLQENYDIAVCFHIHMPFIVWYVAERIKAEKRLAWIHNDFKMSKYPVESIAKYLEKYQHIFAVSEQLKDEFIEILPQFANITTISHNIISLSYIKYSLNNTLVPEYPIDDTIKILTIGRLDKQKGYDIAISVCEKLKVAGYKFQWFALGSGAEEAELRRQIIDQGLENTFILLGIRINPYPYIDQCDIYVQPSRHEGYGIAMAEARLLCKPIICTDFIGARDQLVNRLTGSIVPTDAKEIEKAIIELINNKEIRDTYSHALEKIHIDMSTEIQCLLDKF